MQHGKLAKIKDLKIQTNKNAMKTRRKGIVKSIKTAHRVAYGDIDIIVYKKGTETSQEARNEVKYLILPVRYGI